MEKNVEIENCNEEIITRKETFQTNKKILNFCSSSNEQNACIISEINK